MKYLKSARGEIQTEDYWRKWSEDFYKYSNEVKNQWERTKRVLGLKPCRKEN